MVTEDTLTVRNAKVAFARLLDAIPKGKYQKVMEEAITVEATLNKLVATLYGIRAMYIDQHGEQADSLPLVQLIDKLMPRT